MTILTTTLPAIWNLQSGERPTPAHEAAAALLELASHAAEDARPMLAQLSAASDATPDAIALGLQLQQLLADAATLTSQLSSACTEAAS